jgi:hypothetical protein
VNSDAPRMITDDFKTVEVVNFEQPDKTSWGPNEKPVSRPYEARQGVEDVPQALLAFEAR